jgi:recA bacterial DNA recombination protein
MLAAQLKAQIEQALPAAFAFYPRQDQGSIPTGIAQIDNAVGGVPLRALTEICGNNMVSSGKTSVLLSLLAQASCEHFCALIDAADGFDPASGQVAGINFSRLLWIRCGKNKIKLPPLEQAFKIADILLQSSGFGLIAVDLSGISERIVRKIPLTTWFRFSRVIERQSAALVFLEQEPHATSCAGLVLRVASNQPVLNGKLFAERNLNFEIVRGPGKKPVSSERPASLVYPKNPQNIVTSHPERSVSTTSVLGVVGDEAKDRWRVVFSSVALAAEA